MKIKIKQPKDSLMLTKNLEKRLHGRTRALSCCTNLIQRISNNRFVYNSIVVTLGLMFWAQIMLSILSLSLKVRENLLFLLLLNTFLD
jgi:hypothetical protein